MRISKVMFASAVALINNGGDMDDNTHETAESWPVEPNSLALNWYPQLEPKPDASRSRSAA